MDENARIAARLHEGAGLLEAQGASPYRVHAYRHAADVVARWDRPLRELFDAQGRAGLETLPGVGTGISSAIAEMLITGRWDLLERLRGEAGPQAAPAGEAGALPELAMLLDVDREYREKAAAGRLPLIAPRRFNPGHKAWLPVLHTERGAWHFTALFSNTARAHDLGRTRDWVVIYFYDGEHREAQCTVVTQPWGPLRGERVVRGREEECLAAAEAQAA
jgi:hypothetical protein